MDDFLILGNPFFDKDEYLYTLKAPSRIQLKKAKEYSDWFENWMSSPETKKRLLSNINELPKELLLMVKSVTPSGPVMLLDYGYYTGYRPYPYNNGSSNADEQALNQVNNVKWALLNLKQRDRGMYRGMYSPDLFFGYPGRTIWLDPKVLKWEEENSDMNSLRTYGSPDIDSMLAEEMTHAAEAAPLELFIKNHISKNDFNPTTKDDEEVAEYILDPSELYASIMRLRKDSGIQPGQVIDEEWLLNNRPLLEKHRLRTLDVRKLLMLLNALAYNKSINSNVLYAKFGHKIRFRRK